MNRLMLVGRLTKNPENRGENNKVCVFTLAVSRAYTNEQGKRDADFIQVKSFKKLGENCSKFLERGSLVSVEAHIKTDSYMKDGKRVFTMDVIADEVRFLSGKKGSDSNNNPTILTNIKTTVIKLTMIHSLVVVNIVQWEIRIGHFDK